MKLDGKVNGLSYIFGIQLSLVRIGHMGSMVTVESLRHRKGIQKQRSVERSCQSTVCYFKERLLLKLNSVMASSQLCNTESVPFMK